MKVTVFTEIIAARPKVNVNVSLYILSSENIKYLWPDEIYPFITEHLCE